MKHKLLQTWARKSAKLLAAFALLATTAFGAKAEEKGPVNFSTADFSGISGYGFHTSSEKNGIVLYGNFTQQTSGTDKRIGLAKYQASGSNGNWIAVKSNSNTSITKIVLQGVKTGSSKNGINLVIYKNDASYNMTETNKYVKDPAGSKVAELTVTTTDQNDKSYNINDKYFLLYNSSSQAQIQIKSIDVYYDDAPIDPNKPAAPTFTPDGGEVDANTTVTIAGDDKTQSLKYWFGDDATAATTVTGATATVTITEACTLNAIAIGEGDAVSATKTASFTINPASYPNTIYYSHCTSDDSGFEAWGVAGVTNPWTIDATYGLKATGYKSGANTETEGVMSSPVLDLTNRANITLDFDQAINMFKNGKTVLSGEDMAQINNYISVVIAEVEDETIPTDWTKLADATLPESQSWNFYAQNPAINLDAYKGKKVRIGFKYTSTTEMAGTWEIKNVLVRGDIAPEIPAPTAAENVTITEGEGSWTIRPESYPVVLTFAVEDGVQMYAKSISDTQAQAAAEGDNDGYTVLEGNTLTLTAQGDNYSVYAMKDGVKSVAKTIVADAATGIAGIEAEDGVAVYFNLQGVRVQNPENGVFIRVQNGKAVKIVK